MVDHLFRGAGPLQARFTILRYDVEKCLALVEERQTIDLADPGLERVRSADEQ